MNVKLFLSSALFGVFLLSGCNVTPPAQPQDTATRDTGSTQAHQETTASIAVVGDETSETTEVSESDVPEASSGSISAVPSGDPLYQPYNETLRTGLHGKKPYVIFFHATWCPTCRQMEKDIISDLENFPAGTNILKADYDTVDALKKEYDVKIQSTVVVLDEDGEVVWQGQDPAMDDFKGYIENSFE